MGDTQQNKVNTLKKIGNALALIQEREQNNFMYIKESTS
jgi:hypothetical protein